MKKHIVLITAMTMNRVIGKEGDLPWCIPEELAWFKARTLGHTVIMGRKTWESLPEKSRPLPTRWNIVVTSQPDYQADGAIVARSLTHALDMAQPGTSVFVIGGASLYEQALPMAAAVLISLVHQLVEGDTYFPKLEDGEWFCTGKGEGESERFTKLFYIRRK